MSIIAMSGLVREKYTPKSQEDTNNPAVFELKPLDGLENMEVISELRLDEDGGYRLTGRGMRLAIKYGLKGWENLFDKDGEAVPFNINRVGDISPWVLSELANKIIDISKVEETERKNS